MRSVRQSNTMRKPFHIPRIQSILSILLVVLAALFFAQFGKRKPRALADTVVLAFLGYTNDSSGVRTGRFRVSNPSPISIDMGDLHEIQVETANGWGSQGLVPTAGVFLSPQHTTMLEFPAPLTKHRWRVWLSYKDHTDLFEDCLLHLKRLGLPVSVTIQAYSACSGPIEP